MASEQLDWLLDGEMLTSENRCNDGACDSAGRLWLGTMHLEHTNNAGALYCIDTNLDVHKKINGTTISNGIAWSLDTKRLYYIDSPTTVVQSFIFDEKSGEIIFEENIVQIPNGLGSPDGLPIDEQGLLGIVHSGGLGVARCNPNTGPFLCRE